MKDLSANPIFQQVHKTLESSRTPKLHVPVNQLTREQQAQYLRDKFGLVHGPGKSKRRKTKRR